MKQKKQKKIPSVPKLQSILNTLRFVRTPIPVIMEAFEKHGDTYSFHIGGIHKAIISADPLFIQHFLQKNHRNYRKSETQTETLAYYVGNGLLTSDGDYWLQQRRLIQPGFHREKLSALVAIIHEVIDDFTIHLDEVAKSGRPINIYESMHGLAFKIVAKALFSTSIADEAMTELSKNITVVQEFIIKEIRQPYLAAWFKLSGAIKKHKTISDASAAIILKVIRERKASKENYNDLLDMLLQARYEDNGAAMSEKQLLDESLILFVAGHETSANALAWTLYLLSTHSEATDKLLAELPNLNHKSGFQELMTMPYSKQVIEESMRIFPPAWITDRISIADDEINGFFIPKGTMLVAFIYGVHHSEKLWQDPETFRPERFDKSNRKNHTPYDYLPFGGGPRLCIGNNFAMMEMQLAIQRLIQRYTFELVPGQDIDPEPLITLRPKNGIFLRLTMRSS